MTIDWTRLAKPQDDGYDVEVLLTLADINYNYRPRIHAPEGVTLCDGAVAVHAPRINMSMGGNTVDVSDSYTQEEADAQTEFLNKWHAGYVGLCCYLDEFWPWRADMMGRGCSSGHHIPSSSSPIHAVYVTVNDLPGCAQGIYHEFAHLRLRTMGIAMETHDGILLTNKDDELYDSSVRFDVKRPMPAVLQGLYAWLMFTENDWQLHHAGLTSASDMLDYCLHNLPKIEAGWSEVEKHARTTAAGADFLHGMWDWATDLLDRCHGVAQATLPESEYVRRCSSARV